MIPGKNPFSTTSSNHWEFPWNSERRRIIASPSAHFGHQCQCRVIQTAWPPQITRVLGAAHGIKGVLADKSCTTWAKEDPAQLVVNPLLTLGSCR